MAHLSGKSAPILRVLRACANHADALENLKFGEPEVDRHVKSVFAVWQGAAKGHPYSDQGCAKP